MQQTMESRVTQLESALLVAEDALDAAQAEVKLVRSDLDQVITILTAVVKRLNAEDAADED